MMGRTELKWRSVFRFSLLLIFGCGILECSGKPAKLKIEPRGRGTYSINIEPDGTSKLTPQEKDLGIPGIDSSRYERLPDKPYADGKECATGQNPFSKKEAKLWLAYIDRVVKEYALVQGGFGIDRESLITFWSLENPATLERLKDNCQSNQCNLQVGILSFVCGPKVTYSFADGTSCIHGDKVDDVPGRGGRRYPGPNELLEQQNKRFKDAYGQNCKSKKCNFQYSKETAICESSRSKIDGNLLYFIALIYFWSILMK